MPPFRIYTLGYAHWSVEEVESELEARTAVLVDIRHVPATTKPGFSKSELNTQFDAQYVHVPGFGNVNYDGGPVELADSRRGTKEIRELEHPPVLMCGCQSPHHCHRSLVAELLADAMQGPIVHLRSPTERAQPSLFDSRNSP